MRNQGLTAPRPHTQKNTGARPTPLRTLIVLLALVGGVSDSQVRADEVKPQEPAAVPAGAPRLEFRLAAHAPDSESKPQAPADWATRVFRRLSEATSPANASPGFAWVPIQAKEVDQKRETTVELPVMKTIDGRSWALLSDAADEALLGDGTWRVVAADVRRGQLGFEIHVELDEAGAAKLGKLTESHFRSRLAIVINGEVVMAPTILSRVSDKLAISGRFTLAEAETLAAGLQPTPAPQPKNSPVPVNPTKESPTERAEESSAAPMEKPAAEKPAKPTAAWIQGRVLTLEGLGIAGAEVALTTNGDSGESTRVLGTAKADPTGAFRIPVTADRLASQEMVGVWARAEGYVAQRDNSTTFVKFLTRGETTVRLVPAAATTIALLDKARRPVEKARIEISRVQVRQGVAYRFPEAWLRDYGGVTDAEGRVTVNNISPETVRQFEVILPGGTRLRFDGDYFLNTKPLAEAPHFTIPAPDTGIVEGVFVLGGSPDIPTDTVPPNPFAERLKNPDLASEPVVVTMTTEVRNPPFGTWAGIYGVATIALTGTQFRAVLPEGALTITTNLTAHQPWQPQIPSRLQVRAGGTLPILIPVEKGVLVRGQIRKGDTHEGIPKCELTLIYGPSAHDVNDRHHSATLVTDEKGQFSAYVPSGPVRIRLNHWVKGYRPIEDWNDGPWNHRDKPLRVPPQDEPFDLPPIDFDRVKPVAGRLVDSAGKPLADWTVYGFPTRWEEQYNGQKEPKSFVSNSFLGVQTDRDGKFEGDVPVSYPPGRWRVSHRTWKTKFEFKDGTYVPKLRSLDPLILEVDAKSEPVGEEERHQDNEVVNDPPR